MNHPRSGFSLLLLTDGSVLAQSAKKTPPELRDPETDIWRVIPAAMAVELARGGEAASLWSGRPEWTQWTDRKIDQYAYPRTGSLKIKLDHGAILIAGGFQSTDSVGPFEGSDSDELSTVLFRKKGTPRWEYAGHMLAPRIEASAIVLPGGRVLVAGGHAVHDNPQATVEIWEPL